MPPEARMIVTKFMREPMYLGNETTTEAASRPTVEEDGV
jgi:hypothetical protein